VRGLILPALLSLVSPSVGFADGGDVFFNLRARHESLAEAGKLGADVMTLRTQLGWRSPQWNGLRLLAEIEDGRVLDGNDDYNSGLNGRTAYAGIGDSSYSELNRLQLSYAMTDRFRLTLGRQYIDFDDGRFVGSAGWRLDQNAHEAIRLDFENRAWRASYVYHTRLTRGPGEDFDWDSDSHLFHLNHRRGDALDLAGFVYLIDIRQPGREHLSNATWGTRLSGQREHAGWRFDYALMFAHQSDHGGATRSFDLDYSSVRFGVSRGEASLELFYDDVDGDGVSGFANPFGKNHRLLGWSDVFTRGGTHGSVDGVVDLSARLAYGLAMETSLVERVSADIHYHDFETARTGLDLGEEWDASVTLSLSGRVRLSWEVAHYRSSGLGPAPNDRDQSWISLSYSR